jgi:lipoyl(octanoyl) transferase
VKTLDLGRIGYLAALDIQTRHADALAAGTGPETLLLLEHDPVYTIGRTHDRSSLRSHLPHPVIETNRGGQATYHGPGQLVGYPILDLGARGRDLHRYLRFLEEFLIRLCAGFGVSASRRDGLTGVWVGPRKIASLGVGIRRWISMHGFALNVADRLEGFDHITPCGIVGVEMTSLSRESGHPVALADVARAAEDGFADLLGEFLPMDGESR